MLSQAVGTRGCGKSGSYILACGKSPLVRVSIQLRVREGCHEPQPCQKSLLRQPITPRSDARLRVFADLNPVRSVKTAISEDVTKKKKYHKSISSEGLPRFHKK